MVLTSSWNRSTASSSGQGGSGGRVVYEKNTMKQHLFVAGTSEVGLCKINDAEHSIENQDGRLSRPFINPRCIFFVLGKDSTI